MSSTEQKIHTTLNVCNSDSTWIISTVYASPRIMERKILWSNLSEVAKLHNLPWLLLGDFNETPSGTNKLGGRQMDFGGGGILLYLSDKDRTNLAAPVFEDEIKQGLWALKPFKSPRADGLHAGFFQFFWADILMARPSRVIGFGNLIHSQKSFVSFDLVFIAASLSGKSLLQEVFSAMWLAPSVRSTKNLFYTSQGTAPLQGIFGGRLEPPQAMAKFLQLDLSEWLKTNCLAKDFISANGIPWRYLFPFAIWTLWKHRN
ncbi:hypothetical protein CFP56_015055 [Quercus suber]|uniref:Endonuclease/exonuclease/phosphatase domain-containing protein n=1 Tax=Quercus suber TaxID=58331 RepID=A0AAW0KSL4_QUESU